MSDDRKLQFIFKSKNIITMMRSSGLGVDPRIHRNPNHVGARRGALAPPSSDLAELKNVGGMSTDQSLFAPLKFVKTAFEALSACPIPDDVPLRSWVDIPDSQYYGRHIGYLAHKKVLEEVKNPDDGRRRSGGPYTAVWKDAGLTGRAIFNLKWTNERSVGAEVRFSLLSAAGVINLLRPRNWKCTTDPGTGEVKGLRFIHLDYANAYYQYPVGEELGNHCCVRVGERLYRSKVASMGFRKHCGNSQALVWGCLLRRKEGEDRLGVPDSVYEMEDAPGCIELDDGGFIVLVYDSVLIATTDPEGWKERVERNSGKEEGVNLVLKYITVEGPVAKFSFCGLEIRQNGHGVAWRLEPEGLRMWQEIITIPMVDTTRTVFRLLGMLRFASSILCWPRRRLGRFTRFQSGIAKGEVEWDLEPTDQKALSEMRQALSEMRSMIAGITNEFVHPKSHIPSKRTKDTVMFVAVDATETHWAVWPMVDGQVVQASMCREEQFRKNAALVRVPIDYGEAYAFGQGVAYLQRTSALVWVIANDNKGVGRAYINGFSRADTVDDVIAGVEIPASIPLVVADVPSLQNVSDIGTRPNKDYTPADREYRRKSTWDLMQAAYANWVTTAKEYHDRPGEVAEDIEGRDTYALELLEFGPM